LYSLNSIFFFVTSTVCSTFLALAGGYAIAKFDYKLSRIIYVAFLLGLLLTPHSILVPLFVMETKLGIDNTRLGVLLPYVAFRLLFLIFLTISFIKGFPEKSKKRQLLTEPVIYKCFGM
jgi:raffinose/stachyose/melibiose transport system permease protein